MRIKDVAIIASSVHIRFKIQFPKLKVYINNKNDTLFYQCLSYTSSIDGLIYYVISIC